VNLQDIAVSLIWVFHIILCVLVLIPGLLFASGGQEPPEITGSVTVDMWHAMGGARI